MRIGAPQVTPEMMGAMESSLASLKGASDVLGSLFDGIIEMIDSGFVFRNHLGNLIFREPIALATRRAGKSMILQFNPNERLVELMSAIASNRDEYTVFISHGWPLLIQAGSLSEDHVESIQ
tara:strand:+ start:201 stop:566 length:366 start_codon:yes stop_codon:yes gene_type:complete